VSHAAVLSVVPGKLAEKMSCDVAGVAAVGSKTMAEATAVADAISTRRNGERLPCRASFPFLVV
jgi:hypothetical protein